MNGNLKLALVASLTANIFLAGGAVGAVTFWVLRSPDGETPVAASPAAPLQPRRALRFAADALSPEQRQAFRRALREARLDAAPSAREARAQRLLLAEALAEPTPDRARIDAAMTRAREADFAVRTRVEQAIAEFAMSLPPADRAVFVEALKRGGTLRAPAAAAAATGIRPPPR